MRTSQSLVFCLFLTTQATAQTPAGIVVSGQAKDVQGQAIPLASAVLQTAEGRFVAGSLADSLGRFSLAGIAPGNYLIRVSAAGFQSAEQKLYVGAASPFLQLKPSLLQAAANNLDSVVVTGNAGRNAGPDKQVFRPDQNLSQLGGSVLQAMQSLPGVTLQGGLVQLRGSDRVAVLVDGKQTALTGFGQQTSLENIPASAIERIEIIHNPSARYDANGQAGIINLVFKKEKKEGFNGKLGLGLGAGALWIKRENLPGIRRQFQATPKLNPSLSLNYRKGKLNWFFGGDFSYQPTLNKNEFITRVYDNGDVVEQQTKRNRTTTVATLRTGMDYRLSARNSFASSVLFSSEKILDRGDQPFFNADLSRRLRLWQFLEDEVKTTITAANSFTHAFQQPGHQLQLGYNYTFHRENERYYFVNQYPGFTGLDSFRLLSNEHVHDLTLDYLRPLPIGRLEAGLKMRYRNIPTSMVFKPGLNSPLDVDAGGQATYREWIPAAYLSYFVDKEKWEAEVGVRIEQVRVQYNVAPGNKVYASDGYRYTAPFPNAKLALKLAGGRRLSLAYQRRVDRPNEFDLRIFPKYDDAEIIKLGNPGLRPQFTNSVDLGFKTPVVKGSFYAALFFRHARGSLTRIATIAPGSNLIYNIMQNAGNSSTTGLEASWSSALGSRWQLNVNGTVYSNHIAAFSGINQYPQPSPFVVAAERLTSGNAKATALYRVVGKWELQFTAIYLAPDLIPQGRIDQRFSLDAGLRRPVQQGRGELWANATDLLNTMVVRRSISANGFRYTAADYYETQVVRAGYNWKF